VGVGVGGELLVQAQDRVAGGHFDGGKQRHGKVLGLGCSDGGLAKARLRLSVCRNFSGRNGPFYP
ncbi:MAG: hypothetical protein ACKOFG_15375, partial [Limnohabitans sp.]